MKDKIIIYDNFKKNNKLRKLFQGNPKYFDEAENIIYNWYDAEDNLNALKNPNIEDIYDMMDAATNSKEVKIVSKALR